LTRALAQDLPTDIAFGCVTHRDSPRRWKI
jgi:hypothetical protein